MIDITKKLQTLSGKPVTILSDKYRAVQEGTPLPLIGYIGDGPNASVWTAEGLNYHPENNLEYVQETLYLNIYETNVGVFRTEEDAKASPKQALSTVKIKYVPGQKDF